MTLGRLVGSTPLDDFVTGADASTETGELLQRIGLIGSLTGITLATGLIVFLPLCIRAIGPRSGCCSGLPVGRAQSPRSEQ